ncbi:MAG: hypothetical protein K2I64_03800 [Muribaculaceae bacterium]|nr:hypothetical protein [Muribaculaceae bacterium]
MKKILSPEKQFCLEMVGQLVKIADELTTHPIFNIAPGTYRAADIHRLLKIKDEEYLNRFQFYLKRWKEEGGMPEDYRAPRSFTVQGMTYTIPRVTVFHEIMYYERLAGVSRRKVHTWTFHDKREVAASSIITFASEKTMKALGAFIKSYNQPKGRFTTLSLSDGCMRGVVCEFEYNEYTRRHDKRKIVSQSPYIYCATNYSPIKIFDNYSFKIAADDIKHLYGECKISVYMDDFSTDDNIMSRNPRIVIQNASGWCVTSSEIEPISLEKIKTTEESFSKNYESDYLPDVKPVHIETNHISDNQVTCNNEEPEIDGISNKPTSAQSISAGIVQSDDNRNIRSSPNSTLNRHIKKKRRKNKRYYVKHRYKLEHRVKKMTFSRKK